MLENVFAFSILFPNYSFFSNLRWCIKCFDGAVMTHIWWVIKAIWRKRLGGKVLMKGTLYHFCSPQSVDRRLMIYFLFCFYSLSGLQRGRQPPGMQREGVDPQWHLAEAQKTIQACIHRGLEHWNAHNHVVILISCEYDMLTMVWHAYHRLWTMRKWRKTTPLWFWM